MEKLEQIITTYQQIIQKTELELQMHENVSII